MPLYEYQCHTCGRDFELLRRTQDTDNGVKCPDCDSEAIERQVSTFSTGRCSTSSSGRFT